MEDKRIVVPEGMMKACTDGVHGLLAQDRVEVVLEAALRWLDDHLRKISAENDGHTAYCAALDDVRRLFNPTA